MESSSASGQDAPVPGELYRALLAYAVRAPSLLNAQPWRVELAEGQPMRLWIDRDRMFPALDPLNRQTVLSQATFLENLEIAASHMGYTVSIDYFPLGWGTDATIHKFPVARVECIPSKGQKEDPLFSSMNTRQTFRGAFDRKPLDDEALTSISGSFENEFTSFIGLTDPAACQNIGELVCRALAVTFEQKERIEEWTRMLRFEDEEPAQSVDGIGLSHMGGGESFFSAITGRRLTRDKVNSDPYSFCEYLMERCTDQVRSAKGYGWISTKGKSRLNQVHAGRALERAWLQATGCGIGLQPFHHILGDYPGMAGIQKELKELLGVSDSHTIQAFFRLGYAVPGKTPTSRRPADSFIFSPSARQLGGPE
jgi:hypothetical protein